MYPLSPRDRVRVLTTDEIGTVLRTDPEGHALVQLPASGGSLYGTYRSWFRADLLALPEDVFGARCSECGSTLTLADERAEVVNRTTGARSVQHVECFISTGAGQSPSDVYDLA